MRYLEVFQLQIRVCVRVGAAGGIAPVDFNKCHFLSWKNVPDQILEQKMINLCLNIEFDEFKGQF